MKLLNLLLVVLFLIGMVEARRRKREVEIWIRPEKHNPPGTRYCSPEDPMCQRYGD
uniref:GEO11768p1 n=1 Tax=Drosophila melanogaster TaxID=7227 RepID=B4ZJA3_DROME|eukprot:NP_001163437.1 seminal fluid protein 70A4, isoform A [Drosophila melanogaster]